VFMEWKMCALNCATAEHSFIMFSLLYKHLQTHSWKSKLSLRVRAFVSRSFVFSSCETGLKLCLKVVSRGASSPRA